MSFKSILCAYLATVTLALAISRQVRINQPNTIEATGQENLVDADRDAAPNASYEFAYDVNDPLSNDVKSHREIRDGENVYGYYTFKEADGSTRVVNYKVGPQTGFEATVERLELGARPEIKAPDHSAAPQVIQENVQIRRPQIRTRGQQIRPQVQVVQPLRQQQQFVEQPKVVVNPFAQPQPQGAPPNPNQYVQATAPEYEYFTYIQDDKPLKKSAADISRRPSRPVNDNPVTPNTQLEQDWKNSVVGRKHIRQQIAMLAKKKEEEEALKAENAAKEEQETTANPTEATQTSSTTTSAEESTEAQKEPERERPRDREEEEEDEDYERSRRGEEEDDFGEEDHEREEEEEEE